MFRSITLTLTLCLTTVAAQAALISRAGGQAYYDDVLNITWVADANLAKTSGYDADGLMTWDASQSWIASLNAQDAGQGYLGVSDWRLPTVTDTGSPGCDNASSGTDCGYNVDLATGEMAHLYYGAYPAMGLGNAGHRDTDGNLTGCPGSPVSCLTNVGPFSNIQSDVYWSGTEYAPNANFAWDFYFNLGYQSLYGKYVLLYAWAVSPGDFAVVPLPPAVWLFGSALGLMGVMRRKISS